MESIHFLESKQFLQPMLGLRQQPIALFRLLAGRVATMLSLTRVDVRFR
jgi:hypothetical protein